MKIRRLVFMGTEVMVYFADGNFAIWTMEFFEENMKLKKIEKI